MQPVHNMCPHRDHSGNFGFILMGNNASCKVTEMGSEKFKMFNGVMRILEDVRHVPKLKKNLIS